MHDRVSHQPRSGRIHRQRDGDVRRSRRHRVSIDVLDRDTNRGRKRYLPFGCARLGNESHLSHRLHGGAVGIVRTPFSGKHRSGSKRGDDYDAEAHFRAPVWCAFAGVGNQRRAHIITRPVVSGHCSILAGPWRSSSSKQRPDKRLKLTGAGFQRKRMFVSKRARTAGEALAPTSARPAA